MRLVQLALALILLAPGGSHAQAPEGYFWEFINVDIEIEESGELIVTETQKYVFTSSASGRERFRWIPLERVELISNVEVFEYDEPLDARTGVERNQIWFRWSHSLTTGRARTFVLKYRVKGAIQVHDDFDRWSGRQSSETARGASAVRSSRFDFPLRSQVSGSTRNHGAAPRAAL